MNEVWSWIAENYKLLVLIVACCLDIGLFLVGVLKKPSKSFPAVWEIVARLPLLINEAEDRFGAGKGEQKFDFVMDKCRNIYIEKTGYDLADGYSDWKTIIYAIESILATPQKKGKK